MPRYAAFLRGVSPMNAKMPELKRCFEAAGFTDVKTVRSSGNVAFDARGSSVPALERKAEAAMRQHLGQAFLTIVRPVDALRAMLDADPFAAFRLATGSQRIITFLKAKPTAKLDLPISFAGARILRMDAQEVFTAYVPSPKGAAFMNLIEKTFGKGVTSRTWDTVEKMTG